MYNSTVATNPSTDPALTHPPIHTHHVQQHSSTKPATNDGVNVLLYLEVGATTTRISLTVVWGVFDPDPGFENPFFILFFVLFAFFL